MDGLFGAAGSIASAAIQAGAVKDAAQMQINALREQRDFLFSQLDPEKVNALATAADVERAKSQLALQGIVDPKLLESRYASQQKILDAINQVGQAPSDEIAALAAEEAKAGLKGAEDVKTRLIDQALTELDLGATLPPDLQAELVQAGLQQGSSIGAGTSSRGLAGELTRKLIGERGLQLQAERQQRAVGLTQAAQDLENQRVQTLASLFPNLKSAQLANLQIGSTGLAASEAGVPEAGLSGQNIANLWAQRVGAAGNIGQQIANVGSQQLTQMGQINSQLAGGLANSASSLSKSIGNYATSSGGGGGSGGWLSLLMG